MIIFFLPVFLAFHATYAAQADSLAKGFASPSTSYGPHVFWHWVNGNIRAAALDEDVDALYESGHGGALISDVNAGIPEESINYGSSAWLENLQHAVKSLHQKGNWLPTNGYCGADGIHSNWTRNACDARLGIFIVSGSFQ